MMTAELVSSPMHAGAVLILSPPADAGPDYVDEVYRDTLARNESIDPRLRRYPHRGVSTGGIWVWRDVDTLDLRQHCQRRTVPAGSDGFWRLIGELDAERLDRSRPMWMAYLIDGLDDGRFAFYIKVHHTIIDGVAGFQMIAEALSTDPNRRSMPPFYADRQQRSASPPTSGGLVHRAGRTGTVTCWRNVVGCSTGGAGAYGRAVHRDGLLGRAHDRVAIRGALHAVQRPAGARARGLRGQLGEGPHPGGATRGRCNRQ